MGKKIRVSLEQMKAANDKANGIETQPAAETQVVEAPAETAKVEASTEEKRERVVKGRWTEISKFNWVHSRTNYQCIKVEGVWKVRNGEGVQIGEFKHLKEAGKFGTAHMRGDAR